MEQMRLFREGREENANRWQLTRMRMFEEKICVRKFLIDLDAKSWHLWLILPIVHSLTHTNHPWRDVLPIYVRAIVKLWRQFPMDCHNWIAFRLMLICLKVEAYEKDKRQLVLPGFQIKREREA